MEGSAQVQRVSEKYLRVKGVVYQVNGGGVVTCCRLRENLSGM
jgi:hypothetical protein